MVEWLGVDAYQGERSYMDPVFFLAAIDIKSLTGDDPLLDWAHTTSMVAYLYEQFACLDIYGATALNIKELHTSYIPDIYVRDFGPQNRLMADWAMTMQARFPTNTPPEDFVTLRPKPPGSKAT